MGRGDQGQTKILTVHQKGGDSLEPSKSMWNDHQSHCCPRCCYAKAQGFPEQGWSWASLHLCSPAKLPLPASCLSGRSAHCSCMEGSIAMRKGRQACSSRRGSWEWDPSGVSRPGPWEPGSPLPSPPQKGQLEGPVSAMVPLPPPPPAPRK